MKGQTPKELFLEYRRKVDELLNDIRFLREVDGNCHVEQELINQFTRIAYLAELYARIASVRDGIDYIRQWREGQ